MEQNSKKKAPGCLSCPARRTEQVPEEEDRSGEESAQEFGYIARRDNVSLRRDRAISGADTSIAAALSRGKASVMSSQDTQAHGWRLADSCQPI